MPADLLELLRLLNAHPEGGRELVGRRRAPEDLAQPPLLARVAPEQQLDVHGQTDRPRLVRQSPHDRLAHPPRRVGREARAVLGIELVDGAQQPEVPLLDQVGERQAAIEIAAGDLDDET